MKLTKNSILLAFAILALVLLSGCATPPVVPIYKTVVVAPDDNLLISCSVSAPPAKLAYKAATPKEREEMLIDHADKQYKNLFLCNDRWGKVRLWKKLELEKQQKNNVKGE
jgi:hypothetical protein